MARPRKDSLEPAVRDRLVDALWDELEVRGWNAITVGAVASRAGCNRTTFYYHYADIDALTRGAIEKLLLSEQFLPHVIFNLATGAEGNPFECPANNEQFRRFALIMQSTEAPVLQAMTKSVVTQMWQRVLCPDGSPLKPEVLTIMDFAIGNALGLLSSVVSAGIAPTPEMVLYFKDMSSVSMSWLCRIQGVEQAEAMARLGQLEWEFGA